MIAAAMGLLPGRASPQEPSAFAALEWPGDVRDLPGAAGALWPWLLAVVAVAVLVGACWRRARGLAATPGVAAAPAVAGTALLRLRALELPGDAREYPAFCAVLKGLVRLHCRERFGLRAEQATSEELVQALSQPADLEHCLQAIDLVLFAARPATQPELAAGRARALAFAAATSAPEVA